MAQKRRSLKPRCKSVDHRNINSDHECSCANFAGHEGRHGCRCGATWQPKRELKEAAKESEEEYTAGDLQDDLIRRVNGDWKMRAAVGDNGDVVISMTELAQHLYPVVKAHIEAEAAKSRKPLSRPLILKPHMRLAFKAGWETFTTADWTQAFDEWWNLQKITREKEK